MIKEKDPKVMKKQSYSNKGSVDYGKTESVSVSNKLSLVWVRAKPEEWAMLNLAVSSLAFINVNPLVS